MADLIQCPKCGLRQTARHAYCARCEYGFTGSPEEYVRADDESGSQSATPTGATPTGSTPTGSTPTGSTPSGRSGGTPSTPSTPSAPSRRRAAYRPASSEDSLRRDRGSLSARLSMPRGESPAEPEPEDGLPDAPSWNMPVRQSASFRIPDKVLDEDPTDEQSRDVRRLFSDPGTSGSDFLIRGRPQGELYASERSMPSEDPLLADLVAGRVSQNPKFTDEFALGEDWDAPPARRGRQPLADPGSRGRTRTGSRLEGRSRSRSGVRNTLSGASEPSRPPTNPGLSPGGPVRSRTNPGVTMTDPGAPLSAPNRPLTHPGRRLTNPGRRLTNPGRPRTNPGAAAPRGTNPGLTAPPVPSEYDFKGIDDLDLDLGSTPRRSSTAPRASVPTRPVPHGPAGTVPGARTPRREPPPPPPRRTVSWREVVGVLLLVLVALFACLALINGLTVYRARASLQAAIAQGISPNGPTPDLPRTLGAAIGELGLQAQLQRTWSSIDGATNTYKIGAELRSPVAGIPLRWKVVREGDFEVEQKIRTLEVYVAAGWFLDSAASQRLSAYGSERGQSRTRPKPPAEPLLKDEPAGDDDDSATP